MSLDRPKIVLDEQTFAKLLEAAYILQEHNRGMQEPETSSESKNQKAEEGIAAPGRKPAKPQSPQPASPADYALKLARIVETQHQIQVQHLELEKAMTLVAERAMDVTECTGAAVGILDAKKVVYRGVAGLQTLPKGTTVPMEKMFCFPCLRTGQVFRCPDVKSELLLDAEECRRRGIESMVAVPIFREGRVAGGLELYYSTQNAFTEQDVYTCQLMAGLVTEALARDEEQTWKKSLATERAAMLEALEKLQPNLAALLNTSAATDTATKTKAPAPAASAPTGPQTCRKCGHKIVGEEQFCGQCGLPRTGDYEPPNMQAKVASLWQMQEAQKRTGANEASKGEPGSRGFVESHNGENPDEDMAETFAHSLEEQMPELFAESSKVDEEPDSISKTDDLSTFPERLLPAELLDAENPREFANELNTPAAASVEISPPPPTGPAPVALIKHDAADWSSAASARSFLEQLAAAKPSPALLRFWNTRRGDIYLAVAVILVVCVIRWGLWSNHSVSATGAANATTQHKSPEAELPLFDRMLIQFGLADPPDAPEDKGNPSVQVWVDTRTALYYCPGADLYGKTPKGKFANQREAQLDQFQPAYRKACN